MILSSGSGWEENPGAAVILENSTFNNNIADLDNGGVFSLGKFTSVKIIGNGNVFADNNCGSDGGVLAASVNTRVTVQGGKFSNNKGKVVSSIVPCSRNCIMLQF